MALVSEIRQEAEKGYAQLFAFFALILFAPLPLAGNRPWSLALLGVFAGVLLLWTLWIPLGRTTRDVWRVTKLPLMLLIAWMLLLGFQLVPLTQGWSRVFTHASDSEWVSRVVISIDTYSTRLYLAKACILSAIFWLALTLVNSRHRIELLARVVVFSGLVQALIGVVLMATGANFHLFFVDMSEARGHGTFVSPDHFAGYLELTLAMGIGLMIAKLDGKYSGSWRQRLHGWLSIILSGKAILRLVLIIMVVGLVASRSRGGNSAFFASLLLTGVLTVILSNYVSRKAEYRKLSKSNVTRSTIIFITSLVVLDVVIIGGVVGVEKVVKRIENTNLQAQVEQKRLMLTNDAPLIENLPVSKTEESVEERSAAVLPAIQLIRDFPWFGTGGGTFFLAFPPYRPSTLQVYYDHPHNDGVEIASEVGLLGLMLLVAMVVHSVQLSLGLLIQERDQLARGMAFASLMGVISFLIHGLVDFNLQIPANAMLFMILLSLPYLMKMKLKL